MSYTILAGGTYSPVHMGHFTNWIRAIDTLHSSLQPLNFGKGPKEPKMEPINIQLLVVPTSDTIKKKNQLQFAKRKDLIDIMLKNKLVHDKSYHIKVADKNICEQTTSAGQIQQAKKLNYQNIYLLFGADNMLNMMNYNVSSVLEPVYFLGCCLPVYHQYQPVATEDDDIDYSDWFAEQSAPTKGWKISLAEQVVLRSGTNFISSCGKKETDKRGDCSRTQQLFDITEKYLTLYVEEEYKEKKKKSTLITFELDEVETSVSSTKINKTIDNIIDTSCLLCCRDGAKQELIEWLGSRAGYDKFYMYRVQYNRELTRKVSQHF